MKIIEIESPLVNVSTYIPSIVSNKMLEVSTIRVRCNNIEIKENTAFDVIKQWCRNNKYNTLLYYSHEIVGDGYSKHVEVRGIPYNIDWERHGLIDKLIFGWSYTKEQLLKLPTNYLQLLYSKLKSDLEYSDMPNITFELVRLQYQMSTKAKRPTRMGR